MSLRDILAKYDKPQQNSLSGNAKLDKILAKYEKPSMEEEENNGILDLLGGAAGKAIQHAVDPFGITTDESIRNNVLGGFISSGARSIGDDLYFVNAKDTGKALNNWADSLEQQLPERLNFSDDPLKYFTSSAGLPRATAEMVGYFAPSVIATLPLTGGTGAVAKALTNIPKVGRFINPNTAQLAMHFGMTTPFDAAAESGRTQMGNEEAGMDPELARQKAWTQFGQNMKALTVSNMLQGGLLGPLAGKGSSMVRRGLAGGGEWLSQVLEESYQKAFENEAKGQDYTYNLYNMFFDPKYADQGNEAIEAAPPAAVISLLTGGLGAYRNNQNKKEQAQQEALKRDRENRIANEIQQVNRSGQEIAQNQADNELFTYDTAQQQGNGQSLRNWSHDITGGKMSDEVHNLIVQAADKYGVDRKLALALATAESNGQQLSPNEAGAMGVMQLIPETARGLGVDPADMAQNIDGGMRYLKQQLDANNGDWRLAAAAYNAGPGAVQKYGGIPPYSETQNYVRRIGELMNSAPADNGQTQSQGRSSIFGVEDYNMPTQSDRISDQVAALNPAWQSVIPQVGGVLKNKFGMDAVISSAARTPEHNREVGGVENSHHRTDATEQGGDALDIVLPDGVSAEQAENIRQYFKDSGLFKEVLFHDVGSGYHLHLGGLQTEKVRNSQGIPIQGANAQQQSSGNGNQQGQMSYDMANEQTKPLFDLNADDDSQVQNIIGDFAEQKYNSSQGNEAAENANLFEGMFDGSGNFRNNKRNRDYIRKNFADELQAYINSDESILEQADRLIAQKRDAGDFSYQDIESAKQAGDINKLRQLIMPQGTQKSNNTQNQQAPKIEQSKTPHLDALGYAQNRGMSNWNKRLQRALELAKEPVSKNADKRLTQAMAHRILADELGITFQPELMKNLQEGHANAINAAHDILAKEGIFELDSDFTTKYAYDNLKDRAETDRAQREKQAEDDRINRWVENQSNAEQGLVNALSQIRDRKQGQENADRKYNEIRSGLSDNELGNVQGMNDEVSEDYIVPKPKPPSTREQEQATKIFNGLMGEDTDQFDGTAKSKQHTVSDDDYLNDIFKNNKAPEKAVKAAVKPISDKLPERKKQAEAVKEVAKANEVELPKVLEGPLTDGNKKAIGKAQEILREKEALPPPLNEADVLSDTHKSYKVRYKVLEADDIIDSGNEAYPKTFGKNQKLQPRDRDQTTMLAQVQDITDHLKPQLVMQNPLLNSGAPIMRNDNVVLNGNGRTMGIKDAYKQGKAEHYKQALIDNAERFGLDREAIEKMKNPILVRELAQDVTDEELADIVNSKEAGSRFGATEQARVDAGKLNESMLQGYYRSDNGDVDFAIKANEEFASKILSNLVNRNDIRTFVDDKGNINGDGITRVTRAILSKAFGDSESLISMLSNDLTTNIQNVANALKNVAPRVAAMNVRIENGKQKPTELSKHMADAARKLSSLRRSGQKISEYLQTQSMFSEEQDADEMREILSAFDKLKSRADLTAFFNKKGENSPTSISGGMNRPQFFLDIKYTIC